MGAHGPTHFNATSDLYSGTSGTVQNDCTGPDEISNFEIVGVGPAVWQNWRKAYIRRNARARNARACGQPQRASSNSTGSPLVPEGEGCATRARALAPDTRPLRPLLCALFAGCAGAGRKGPGGESGHALAMRRKRNPNGRAFVLKRCSWSSSVAWPASPALVNACSRHVACWPHLCCAGPALPIGTMRMTLSWKL